MGQKIHPFGLRLGIIQDWRSRWYAEGRKYAKYLEQDIKIRKYLGDRLARAGIAKIEIERADKALNIFIFTARPGIVIGKGGMEVDQLRKDIEKMADTNDVQISVLEVRFPEQDANLLAQNVAEQLVARVPFRRAMRRAVTAAMKTGAKGVKVMIAGRLGGREMARTEWSREGRVPLHTLRADIDYGYYRAATTFGSIGVKVWLYKGEKTSKRQVIEEEPLGLTKPKTRPKGRAKAAEEEPLGLIKPKTQAKKADKEADTAVQADEGKSEKAAIEVKTEVKEDTKKEKKAAKAEKKAEAKVEEKPAEKKTAKKTETKAADEETEAKTKKEKKAKKTEDTEKAEKSKTIKAEAETKKETKTKDSKDKKDEANNDKEDS